MALAVFLGTFVYEDGATLLAAGLAAAGRLDTRLALASAFLGIWISDFGLYLLGAGLRNRTVTIRWGARLLTPQRLAGAEAFFSRHGTAALVLSRFLPGSRLPLYLAAGLTRISVRWFLVITGLCAALWVGGTFVLTRLVSQGESGSLRNGWFWLIAVAFLLLSRLLVKPVAKFAAQVRTRWRKYRRWEFWPGWLFYPPVAGMCAWLGLRYRGFSLPTVANPGFHNGGIVGESKFEALQSLMAATPEVVADAYRIPSGDTADRLRQVEQLCRQHSIPYPFVLKPDVGQRGAGFKLIYSREQAERYLSQVTADTLLQRYVAGPREAGIFYYRFPHWRRGRIFAITEKVFPEVTGDGARTLEELIQADLRASLLASTYMERFAAHRHVVLPAGEQLRLVEAGNHCQGCIFRDGDSLLTPQLARRIDEISRAVPGFFVGRYDIRYSSEEELRRGEGFQIIELNGAASEATSIYDPRNSLLSAYRTLYRQWRLVYAIGAANRRRGYRPPSLWQVWQDWRGYQRISASYPAAD